MDARQASTAITAGCSIFIAACGTHSGVPLEVDDNDAIASLRVAITRAGVESPSHPARGFAFELGISRAKGSSTQSIGAGDFATVGSRSINGPAQLTNEADVRFIDALVRWRLLSANGPFGLELLGGLSQANYDFKAGGLNGSSDSTMATFGVGGLYRAGADTTAQLRYSVSARGSAYDDLTAHRVEISVAQSFGRNFAGRLGLGWWKVVNSPPAASELRTQITGPFLGVDFSF